MLNNDDISSTMADAIIDIDLDQLMAGIAHVTSTAMLTNALCTNYKGGKKGGKNTMVYVALKESLLTQKQGERMSTVNVALILAQHYEIRRLTRQLESIGLRR